MLKNTRRLTPFKRNWLVLLSVFPCSCITHTPLPESSATPLPATWHSNPQPVKPSSQNQLSNFRFPISDFPTSPIPALVDEALANSPFLQSAEALVEAAESQLRTTRSARQPQLKGRFRGTRQKHNLGTNAAFGRYFGGNTFITNHYSTDLVLDWELDLWGRLRDLEKAARSDYQAALLDFESARLSIAAQTARAWTSLTSAHLRKQLAAETAESYQTNLGIIQNRFRQGLASALDLRLTQASLTRARAGFENQSRQEAVAQRALEILLTRYPAGKATPSGTLPELKTNIPAGIPAQLLERRPDIRAARLRLLASGIREREAAKGFLPNIGLTSSTGTASQNLRNLTDSSFSAWNLLGNLAQPILDSGRIKARQQQTSALRKKAAADYQTILLGALREVEDALDAESRLAREETALRQSAEEFDQAEALAWDRYRQGLVDIITALESQRRANEARSAHLALQTQRIYNRIQLHLALATPIATQP